VFQRGAALLVGTHFMYLRRGYATLGGISPIFTWIGAQVGGIVITLSIRFGPAAGRIDHILCVTRFQRRKSGRGANSHKAHVPYREVH
jgi:hypothetical protein